MCVCATGPEGKKKKMNTSALCHESDHGIAQNMGLHISVDFKILLLRLIANGQLVI